MSGLAILVTVGLLTSRQEIAMRVMVVASLCMVEREPERVALVEVSSCWLERVSPRAEV